MKKVMISQPMRDKTKEEILVVQDVASKFLKAQGYEVLNTVFHREWYIDLFEPNIVHKPLYFLARTLLIMSKCQAVYFCKGWEDYPGCRIEHEAAKNYGLEILYEDQGRDE